MPESPRTPDHIAIIMDGNGRWAKERGLPRREGHRAGAESVREAVEVCRELGVRHLTLYAFSAENWRRPQTEIDALMMLLDRFLAEKTGELNKQGVRLHTIGQIERLPAKNQRRLAKAKAETANNRELNLILALSYGGREEITAAARRLAEKVKAGELTPEEIDNDLLAQHLDTADFPDPDLLVRTSGELRLSNFLLWQLSYAEIVTTKKYWPEFKREDLRAAVAEYSRRHRRFGGL
ncbi:isoprenyl transferase [Roseibacillus ishigakijimensis]|uniref:Isoprenyl transferase n=1 Tax=Roseibacillus ishigakijimensis TaxID=454146 RepID=A0A934VP12_9BACT|nr:isoprenyl transferase [Roseibacillus ishigakijimensis]MBK1835610.1 isoprenyl transferase [Roseibacillus ishigakijimensis]